MGYIRPCVFCGGDVALAVQGDVGKGVAVDELDRPIEKSDEPLQNTKGAFGGEVAVVGLGLLRDRARLAEHVDKGDDQAAETDGAEAVCQCATSGAPCWTLGHVVGAKVPAAVDAGDDRVDQVLQDFGNPVSCKSDEDDETDDFG